jgi:hypothetical protein
MSTNDLGMVLAYNPNQAGGVGGKNTV